MDLIIIICLLAILIKVIPLFKQTTTITLPTDLSNDLSNDTPVDLTIDPPIYPPNPRVIDPPIITPPIITPPTVIFNPPTTEPAPWPEITIANTSPNCVSSANTSYTGSRDFKCMTRIDDVSIPKGTAFTTGYGIKLPNNRIFVLEKGGVLAIYDVYNSSNIPDWKSTNTPGNLSKEYLFYYDMNGKLSIRDENNNIIWTPPGNPSGDTLMWYNYWGSRLILKNANSDVIIWETTPTFIYMS